MNHFVLYHNPDTMGYDAEIIGFSGVTAKPVEAALGHRVWIVTGRGELKRSYTLVMTFVVDSVGASDHFPGMNHVSASTGTAFRPEVSLDFVPWFKDFLRSMGNFGLGFQRITDLRYVEGLEQLVHSRTNPATTPAKRRRPAV